MFHTVFFWLKPDLTDAQRATFEEELRLITKIPYLTQAHISRPANTTERPGVTEHSFDFSLIVEFASMADHDRYQTDDADHDRFINTCKGLWSKVSVLDSQPC